MCIRDRQCTAPTPAQVPREQKPEHRLSQPGLWRTPALVHPRRPGRDADRARASPFAHRQCRNAPHSSLGRRPIAHRDVRPVGARYSTKIRPSSSAICGVAPQHGDGSATVSISSPSNTSSSRMPIALPLSIYSVGSNATSQHTAATNTLSSRPIHTHKRRAIHWLIWSVRSLKHVQHSPPELTQSGTNSAVVSTVICESLDSNGRMLTPT